MNKLYLALIFSTFVASNAVASDIGKALGKSDVSRLELLANNMNLLAVLDKFQKSKEKKEQPKGDSPENTLTK